MIAIHKTARVTYRVDFWDRSGKRLRKTFPHVDADNRFRQRNAPADVARRSSPYRKTRCRTGRVDSINESQTPVVIASQRCRIGGLIDKYVAPMLGEIQIQRVGVETVESAAAEWSP
jgi:hypothetical protein